MGKQLWVYLVVAGVGLSATERLAREPPAGAV
jgi:hypothetical protein